MFPLQGAQVWSLVGELRYSCSAIETKKKDHVMFRNCLASAHLPPECRLLYAAAKSLQSYPTLCDPTDGSPPGSPVPGILQARTLEWVAISFSNAWTWKVKEKSLSHVWPLAWTAAYQAPPSMGFSRQEYWSGVPLPSPGSCIRHSNNISNRIYPKIEVVIFPF